MYFVFCRRILDACDSCPCHHVLVQMYSKVLKIIFNVLRAHSSLLFPAAQEMITDILARIHPIEQKLYGKL